LCDANAQVTKVSRCAGGAGVDHVNGRAKRGHAAAVMLAGGVV